MSNPQYRCLRLILGDQLNSDHSWFDDNDDDVLYLVAELPQETAYVKHHVQKLCAFFAAMQNFADEIAGAGHEVLHLTLDDSAEFEDLPGLIAALCERYRVEVFEYQAPDEYRLRAQLRALELDLEVNEYDSEHFLLADDDLDDCVEAGRHQRMEAFYRKLRRRFDILMRDGEPEGGSWNYDAENRARLKPKDLEQIPAPLCFDNDVGEILKRLERHRVEHFGTARKSLPWPVTRAQALQLLAFFCERCLPRFGRFQDAMTGNSEYGWSLYHARLSFALNSKMLDPREVIETAIAAWEGSEGGISLAQIEGFVRQILGWREFVRAVYWVNMPAYAELNHLGAKRGLPAYFWSGETRMNCMRHALGQSLEYAYAHHIQRLMVIGNFCLLAGIDPKEVDAWYLGVYIDAIEWVEMPNTRGMSQFADAGLIASKPYSASANYINKMSDYCKSCAYDAKQKVGEDACPFNSLYWNFMNEHRASFAENPRIGMIYRNWDKQEKQQRDETLRRAQSCLQNIEQL